MHEHSTGFKSHLIRFLYTDLYLDLSQVDLTRIPGENVQWRAKRGFSDAKRMSERRSSGNLSMPHVPVRIQGSYPGETVI